MLKISVFIIMHIERIRYVENSRSADPPDCVDITEACTQSARRI